MKIKSIYIVIFLVALSLLSCNNTSKTSDPLYLKRPKDTNLEFWITERVTSIDLEEKGCTYLPGWMGAEEYLDSRYTADTSEAMAKAPDIHVTYLLTGYPDTLDDPAITHIEITDPSITVYGLTMNSTDNQITSRLNELSTSFSYITTTEECYLSVKIQNCSFGFMSTKIVIDVPVTNNSGIVY